MPDQPPPVPSNTLDAANTGAGAMERLFLLEAVTPAYVGKYDAARNLEAMRLMRQTIENRLKSPGEYGARGARTTTDIIELGNQFAGFGHYPVLSRAMAGNPNDILRIANDPKHTQQTGVCAVRAGRHHGGVRTGLSTSRRFCQCHCLANPRLWFSWPAFSGADNAEWKYVLFN